MKRAEIYLGRQRLAEAPNPNLAVFQSIRKKPLSLGRVRSKYIFVCYESLNVFDIGLGDQKLRALFIRSFEPGAAETGEEKSIRS